MAVSKFYLTPLTPPKRSKVKLRHFVNIFAEILHEGRAAIYMKLIRWDFSLKAWVRAPWVHRPSIKSQLWYISYLMYLYLHLLPCCCICDSLWMQHGHVLKKTYILTFWPPRPGMGGGGGYAGEIFATMWLHSWFHFIWYATWPCFKKVNFDIWPNPQGLFYGWRGLAAKCLLPRFCICDLIWYAIWPCS